MEGILKISILVYDLTSNPIVRVYPIAKVLQRHFDIEVIGSYRGTELFAPYQGEFEFKAFRYHNTIDFATKVWPAIHRSITGDVIYAFKPRLTSYAVALVERLISKKPILLDIDDWEMSQFLDKDLYWKLRYSVNLLDPNSLLTTWLMEKMVPLADNVTVVSSYLRKKFGGIRLVTSADTDLFNPVLYNQKALRKKWGIPMSSFIVLFAGKPVPHKGVVQIVQAFRRLKNLERQPTLLLVGGGKNDPYVKEIIEEGCGMVIQLSYQPHALMPELLAISDCVALPQMPSYYARAQVPAKVFEAMAMGIPVVASRMSDLPEIIDSCGILFEPGDVDGLSNAMQILLENKNSYISFSSNARTKAEKMFSWNSMEETLLGLFQPFV